MAWEELKQRQGAMWGSAPFEHIAETIADMHDTLVERLAPVEAERWLDVGCGTGAVAERAAAAGADVTGLDVAPPLLETARRRAEEAGLSIRYDAGDAEAMPYEDESFEVVASAVGVMFAPDQERAAAELARVCRPGGRVGLTGWTPDGRVGDFFRMLEPYRPPAPPGLPSPLEWGRSDHVRSLLGDSFDLDFAELVSTMEAHSAEATWDLFRTSFGPVKTIADSLEPDRLETLKREFMEHMDHGSGGPFVDTREYLFVLGTRRA